VRQKPELLTHPVVQQSPMRTLMPCMGVELRPYVYSIRHAKMRRLYST
jgi:hypothetical protein